MPRCGHAWYLAFDRGYFKDEGLDVTLTQLSGQQSDVLPAVVSGSVQIASLAPGAAHFNAIARGVAVPAVVALQVITSDDRSGGIVVRKQLVDTGAVKTYADLKGKKIGLLGLNSTSQFLSELALAKGGLSKSDVEFVNLDSAAQVVALSTGVLDAAYTFEPYVGQAITQGVGVLQFPRGDYGGGTAGTIVVISPSLAQNRPDAIQRYVAAIVRGLRDYYNTMFRQQGDRNQVIASLAAHTAVKDPATYASITMSTVDPNGEIDSAAMQKIADYLVANGAVDQKVDLSKVIDRTHLDAALNRLGRV